MDQQICVLNQSWGASIPPKGLFIICPVHSQGHYIYHNGKIVLGKPQGI